MRYRVIQRRAPVPGRASEDSRLTSFGSVVRRITGVLLALSLTAVTAVSPPSAAAQDGDGQGSTTASTTTPTTEPPTSQSTTAEPATTETTLDDSTTSSVADATTTTSTGDDQNAPTSNVEATTTLPESTDTSDTSGPTDSVVDPLVDEAPADDPLDPNITVPPPSGAAASMEFAPVPLLWGNIREAEEKWAEAVAAKVEAINEVRSLRLRAKELDLKQDQLEGETQQTIEELAAATERLKKRAVLGFIQTSSGNPDGNLLGPESEASTDVASVIFQGRDLLLSQRRTKLIHAVVDVDQLGLGDLDQLRERLGATATELVQRSAVVESSLRRAELSALELDDDINQAKIELEAFKAGSDIYIDGVVFPIAGPYSVPLINSFGFPRMPGTPDAHSHQGIDIFAPRGTPLVAAERGVIGRIGNGRLGGLKFWLRGASGADWYYAHLNSFAPGLHNGQVVEAGELLGYVGNTGNAVGTPPHLHLEIHPDGGAAVNPYPLLKVVSDLDLKSFVEGTHPGFRYQAVVQEQPQPDADPTTTAVDPAPTSTDPSTTAPSSSTTAPATTEPSTTEPSTTQPSATEPSTSEPSTTDPGSDGDDPGTGGASTTATTADESAASG